MDTETDIYTKLFEIQTELKAPKEQYSEFGGYYYRNVENILTAVKPLLQSKRCILLLSDKVEQISDRYYVVAVATLIDIDHPSERITTESRAREAESRAKFDVAQLTGTASSYARKYALNGLFALDDAKDPDALPPVENKPEKSKPANKVTSKQLADLQALAKKKGVPIENIVNGYHLNSLQDMDAKQWAQAMTGLRKRADV